MLRFLSFFVSIVLALPLFADDKPIPTKGIEGHWLGTIKVGAIELRLAFHISKKDDKLTATMDSIDQGERDVALDSATFIDGTFTVKHAKSKLTYIGKLAADGSTLKGEIDQGGVKIPLDFKRQEKAFELKRPQEPKKPYPYVDEEVTFPSIAKDVKLAGTLTKPKGDGPFPCVVTITGSGPQDRDESLLGHKPFWVLADHLARKGIAVLRFDDRGIGKSTGDFEKATSRDFADDVAGAVAFLKARKYIGKIGLIGHSEGGMIAPMVAAEDSTISFIILLAGPGTPCDELLYAQGQLLVKAMGGDEKAQARQAAVQKKLFTLAKEGTDAEKIKAALKELEKDFTDEEKKELAKAEAGAAASVAMLATPWFKFFLNYDPAPTLKKVECPVLAVNGEKDLQVPPNENLAAIEKALNAGGNTDVTVKEYPGLNHLFQTSKTGLPSEYGKIEETMSPAVLEAIAEWIEKRK